MLSVLMLASRQVTAGPISEFVSVDSLRFEVNGTPYHFAGTNCYYLMTWAADPSLRADVDEVLDEAALMGFKVIRT